MKLHQLFKTPFVAMALLVAGTPLTGNGGFIMRADYSPSNGVALVVRATGCHQPAKAVVVGMAEGMVDGVRKTETLKLKATGKGIYDVIWDRPAKGVWVLTITGTYNGNISSLIIETDSQGKVRLPEPDKYGMRFKPIRRALAAAEVASALEQLAIAG
jgi:hypothetical protein